MKVSKAVDACLEYHQASSEKNKIITYSFVIGRFRTEFEKGALTNLPRRRFSHFSLLLPRGKSRVPSTPGAQFCEPSLTTSFTAISFPSRTPVTAG